MKNRLQDIIRFQSERLFEGAVNLDWLLNDPERSGKAASAFVFHGPKYHGVRQEEIGTSHGHNLQDTASFTHAIVRSCIGLDEKPFSLAIAGYGTGKSHLALTLGKLLSGPSSEIAEKILTSLKNADSFIGNKIQELLDGKKPCLTLSLNGMENYDLTAEISKQIVNQLRTHGADLGPVVNLRPRFAEAASRVKIMSSNPELKAAICECTATDNVEAILDRLELQDEKVYDSLCPIFENNGLRIPVYGGESLKDLIDVACNEYCGMDPDKPFISLIVLFDEFGRYAEFATMKRQIAGSGVLQHLFEGIQNNSDKTTFIGFIQFELNSYVQRIAPEFKNDIIRVITRYQNSDKFYLSTNLETLIAHLIEKKQTDIIDLLDSEENQQISSQVMMKINRWFPLSLQYRLWKEPQQFHNIIRKGCWPLSPYSVWLLFYLSAAGRHLQERSALSLLSKRIDDYLDTPVAFEKVFFELTPCNLWSEELLQEFISSEEEGQQGTIAHAYATVLNKHSTRLNTVQKMILQAIVLSAKLAIVSKDKPDAEKALSAFSGVPLPELNEEIKVLHDEFNIIEWDKNFLLFDILGDAVPRTQFLAFLRQRVASAFDENGKAELFVRSISRWCDKTNDLECDFAEVNEISTKEWGYQAVASNLMTLKNHIEFAAENWRKAMGIDQKRGTIIYCYLGPNEDIEKNEIDAIKFLKDVSKRTGQVCIPILVVFIVDDSGEIGRMIAELSVLSDSISEQDKEKFGNLIGSHEEKTRQLLSKSVEIALKQRHYVTSAYNAIEARRLNTFGRELFSAIYKKPLPFNFDGYATKGGQAAISCHQLTLDLLNGKLDFQTCSSKPQKERNRSLNILQHCWDCFNKTTGKIAIPKQSVAHSIVTKWRYILDADDNPFVIAEELKAVCLPPFGANIASAGLLFGVFLAPRRETVFIKLDNGSQVDVSQWLQKDLFRNRVIDLDRIGKAEIINIGEESSQWEILLDDWENEETHLGRIQIYRQAEELRKRISVPPALAYQYKHLEELTANSSLAIEKMNQKRDNAWNQIDKGCKFRNGSDIIWGAASLGKLLKKLENEYEEWTNNEKSDLENDLGRARQYVIGIFSDWLPTLTLRTDNPDQIGEFKHKVGKLLYDNLLLLNLNEQAEELKKWVAEQIRNCQVQADASRLIQEIDIWLTEHSNIFKIKRVAQIRSLIIPGKEFGKKLQTTARKVNLPEMDGIRNRLNDFLNDLKNAEADLSKKANDLWDSEITCFDDIDPLLRNVNDLIATYEGCDNDLEDLSLMQKAIKLFKESYSKLYDFSLDWKQFEALTAKIKTDAGVKYGDNDPPPWDIEETIDVLSEEISEIRKDKAIEWLKPFLNNESRISVMGVKEADGLRSKLLSKSPLLSDEQIEIAQRLAEKAEERCNGLEVEWLYQKFMQLSENAQEIFLSKIGRINI